MAAGRHGDAAAGWVRFDLPSCGSTNAEASAWAAVHPTGEALFTAVTQTGGRGQWGRSWASPAGGAWFSLVLRRARADELVALEAARAVRSALSAWVPAERLSIKPPNDVLLDEKKVAGVLCEQSVRGVSSGTVGVPDQGRGVTLIVGVGVNANVDTATLGPGLRRPAVSLREARDGLGVDVAEVIDGCVSALRARLADRD